MAQDKSCEPSQASGLLAELGDFASRGPRSSTGHGFVELSAAVALILLVSVPTMVVEETWHGHPMIDQPSFLWVVPACLVAVSFLLGGAVIGHFRPSSALRPAIGVGAIAVLVLVIAALCRRLWVVHEGVPGAVLRLWCIGAVAGFILSATGSFLGHRLFPRPVVKRTEAAPEPERS